MGTIILFPEGLFGYNYALSWRLQWRVSWRVQWGGSFSHFSSKSCRGDRAIMPFPGSMGGRNISF